MNKRQRKAVVIGIGLLILVALFLATDSGPIDWIKSGLLAGVIVLATGGAVVFLGGKGATNETLERLARELSMRMTELAPESSRRTGLTSVNMI